MQGVKGLEQPVQPGLVGKPPLQDRPGLVCSEPVVVDYGWLRCARSVARGVTPHMPRNEAEIGQ